MPEGYVKNLAVIASIMDGNAAEAVASMQSLGGMSAAALPSTLVGSLSHKFG
jgi:hypothetical protein